MQGFPDRFDRVRKTMPLDRFGDADEAASLVEYLCRDQAAFITGANLRIDGWVSVLASGTGRRFQIASQI